MQPGATKLMDAIGPGYNRLHSRYAPRCAWWLSEAATLLVTHTRICTIWRPALALQHSARKTGRVSIPAKVTFRDYNPHGGGLILTARPL